MYIQNPREPEPSATHTRTRSIDRSLQRTIKVLKIMDTGKNGNRMMLLWMVSVLLFSVSLNAPLVSSAHRQSDLAALRALKSTVEKDPNGALSSWKWDSSSSSHADPCRWRGVTCSDSGRVTEIDLSSLGLVGVLPASAFAGFNALRALNLSFNAFQGNVSSLFGLPPVLQSLDLSCNALTGSLESTPSLPQLLTHLNLSHNNFTGALPISSLLTPSLVTLDASYNNFSGPITATNASCPSLSFLDLSSNHLSGEISSPLSSCAYLQSLNVSSNELTGTLPKSLGDLTALQVLDVSHNHIEGPIPPELGNCCDTLRELYMSSNNFSGNFPSSFSGCTSLRVLDMSNNNISGNFPDSILGNLLALQRLIFTNNFITGPFPASVSSCPGLKVVDFSSNALEGPLPASLCSAAHSLEELRLPDNKISGNVPSTIGLCRQLKTIDLSINNISGRLPSEIGRLSNLERLMMWFNHLEGSIPPELGRCSRLKDIILNNNYLTGRIPMTIAYCTDLEWIALSSNKLSGRIPKEFGRLTRLSILQLANNSLDGPIPGELGNCSSLLWLDLNNNRLSGHIPRHLGRQPNAEPLGGILSGNTLAFLRNVGNSCNGVGGLVEFAGIRPERLLQVPTLKGCQFTRLYSGAALNDWTHYESLEYLDLSYNSLIGTIPEELGDMVALQVLELAHNNLTGELPPSLGKLRNLGVFEASHNNLTGEIPESFSNLTFLVQIDLSYNHLVGQIPSRGQLSTLPASQYANNPGLCGVPLEPCGSAGSYTGVDSPPEDQEDSNHFGIAPWAKSVVVGTLVPMSFVCVLLIWTIAVHARKREKEGEAAAILSSLHTTCNTTTWKLGHEKEPLSINVATFERPLRKLTFSALIEATNGFCANSLIGSGGFGEVFKATLKDGSTVAIKKLIRLSCQGDREFMAEMETLGKIKHRNLVPLLGYCKVGEERLLVYEYMEFGSLEDMLHSKDADKKRALLTWEVRKRIARGAAKGLAFLHHNCIPHIIHRDMKSSNVLLDKNVEARVSDFGMARLISALDTHLTISALAGTPGYVPPEYYQSVRCTAKGDVYSFGVLLLEILTGKRPTDKEEFGDTNLVGWVRMKISQGRAEEVIDPDIFQEVGGDVKEVLKHVHVALQCLDDFPSRRPSMLQVVSLFKDIVPASSQGGGGGGGAAASAMSVNAPAA